MDYKVFKAKLGAVVKRRRIAKKLTQWQLAEQVGVEQPTINRIENAKQGFDSMTLFNIARELGSSLTDLMSEVEEVVPAKLPAEAVAFAREWMELPPTMREEYRKRIGGLATAMRQPVADEAEAIGLRGSQPRRTERPRPVARRLRRTA